MHFPTKKNGGQIFSKGSRGVWQKTRLFPDFFFRLPSLIEGLKIWHLKFHSVAAVPHFHRIVAPEDHLFPKGLDPMLEVTGGKENVVLHHLVQFIVDMIIEILLPGNFQDFVAVLDLDCDVFPAIGVHIVVDFAAPLL